jgi:hypothetical protein
MTATALRNLLSGLSAPEPMVEWARPFVDLRACWDACPQPDWQLWLAARLARTPGQRREVVLCATELARRAKRGVPHVDPRVGDAISAVEAWASADMGHGAPDAADAADRAGRDAAALVALADAERAVLLVAAQAAVVADEESDRARLLFRSTPRSRGGSFGASRAMSAYEGWRAADRTRRLALAAAYAARAAAQSGDLSVSAEEWADCVSNSAAYSWSVRTAGKSAARRWARMARRHLHRPEPRV